MGAFKLLHGRPTVANTDAAPFLAYDSGGFLATQASSFSITTTQACPSGSTLVLFHAGGSGAQLTGVSGASGTWALGQVATNGLSSRSASIKLTADLPSGSTLTLTQNASTGPSVLLMCWAGGIALDVTAPTAYTAGAAWSTTISAGSGGAPEYVAAYITSNADIGSVGHATGWQVAEVHGSSFGTVLMYRRLEDGNPVTISSGASGSGQAMVYVTFTAPAKGATSNVVVTSVAALNAVVANADAGATILLASGTYTGATFASKTYSPAVTIKSQNLGSKATLVNTNISGVNGLTFDSVNIAASGTSGFAVLSSSQNIILQNFSSSGDGRTNVMVTVHSSTGITIQDGAIDGAFRGIEFFDSSGVIQRNKFTGLGEDAIHFSACSNLTIRRNYGTNWNTLSGEHADFVQHTVGGTGTSSSNITIQENLDTLGSGLSHQGYFLADMPINTGDVSRNMCVGPNNHGLMLSACTSVTADGNKLIPLNVTTFGAWLTEDNDTTCTITNNQYGALVQSGTNTGNTLSGNTIVTDPGDSGAAAIAAFRALYTDIPT